MPTDTGTPYVAVPPTERRNPASMNLDRLGTLELLELINREDATVPGVVHAALPQLSALVDKALLALRAGGRIHYFGAGAGGRIALGDALELEPTYGVGRETVVAHLAGGQAAGFMALEHAEDQGPTDSEPISAQDLVIGITASGRTPYVAAALRTAQEIGATTALLSSDPNASAASHADLHIVLDTGPEVVTGSTRMKAGTAQKLALNAFSTALMVRTGRTWSNLMVAASARNTKLRDRAVRTLVTACQITAEQAATALADCGEETDTALVALQAATTADEAREALYRHHGQPWAAIRALTQSPRT